MNSKKVETIITALRRRKDLLKTKEVMKILNKTRNTICRWVREQVLPAKVIGNGYAFDPIVFANWLEARQIQVD
jgi:predicted DNA-binding transcriptional regulator AlpA